jgi:cardiolipin synthase
VGSTNLNLASWMGNRELDVVVENAGFGREMEAMFLDDLGNSTEIVLHRWARVRPAENLPRARLPGAGGSATRAAAGALRVGNALGSVLAARRVHGPAERWLMAQGGLLLAVLATGGFLWPRLLAWPLAGFGLWLGLALLVRAARRRAASPPTRPRAAESPPPRQQPRGPNAPEAHPARASSAARRVPPPEPQHLSERHSPPGADPPGAVDRR